VFFLFFVSVNLFSLASIKCGTYTKMAYKYAGQICIKGRRNAEMKLERTVCFFGLFLLYLFRLFWGFAPTNPYAAFYKRCAFILFFRH
jgi:hypothetical protein